MVQRAISGNYGRGIMLLIGEKVTCVDAGEGSNPRGSRIFSKDWAGGWLCDIRGLVVEELVGKAVAIIIGG